jgi:hypothetical protein
MLQRLLGYVTVKDLIIAIAVLLIAILILKIKRLKNLLAEETHKLVFPQLNIEIDEKELKMYLKNTGVFAALDIQIEDAEVLIDDYGFKLSALLKFEAINILKPGERTVLIVKAFDAEKKFLADFSERIMPHLINARFKIQLFCANIEGRKICVVFNKIKEAFYAQSTIFCP